MHWPTHTHTRRHGSQWCQSIDLNFDLYDFIWPRITNTTKTLTIFLLFEKVLIQTFVPSFRAQWVCVSHTVCELVRACFDRQENEKVRVKLN